MPHTFPSTAQSELIVEPPPPGPQPTPPSASRSVDDADFIGEKRVQGDPRGPRGPPHNFGRIGSFGKKYVALGNLACGRQGRKTPRLTPGRPLEVVRLPRDSRACGVP